MITVSVENLKKSFGNNTVLHDVSFVLQKGQRIGLVGVNGSGKSTLLKILAGILDYDEGRISIAKNLTIGYMQQLYTVTDGNTVLQEAEQVFEPLRRIEEKMRLLEQQMNNADEETFIALGDEYAKLQSRFDKAEGYAWPSKVQGALIGMGFPREMWHQDAKTLSGGEKTRLGLAKLLLQQPDILLLDEPTNHLDLEALQWLEEYLLSYTGAAIIVSHDRYFLDKVATHITELLLGKAECYTGNYSKYMQERSERFESRMKAYDLQQEEIKKQEKVIQKLRSFNREKSIKRAESRQKMLDKIERLEKPVDEKQVHFSFKAYRKTGFDVLFVHNCSKSFDQKTIFENIDLDLKAGDRVALIGKNGIGKSTLLKCIAGIYTPDTGYIRFGANVDTGYYAQQQEETLHGEKTVLREVWDDFPLLDQTVIRSALGRFLFSGEDVFEPVSVLSGGEKGKLALVKLMLLENNFLLLDEPTNHLDMDSREVLEDALEDFTGTILAVSHDRYFINRFANKVACITSNGLEIHDGNYDDFVRLTSKAAEDTTTDGNLITKTASYKEKRKKKNEKEQEQFLWLQLQKAEQAVEQAEALVNSLETKMSMPDIKPVDRQQLAVDYRNAKRNLEESYNSWEIAEKEYRNYVKAGAVE